MVLMRDGFVGYCVEIMYIGYGVRIETEIRYTHDDMSKIQKIDVLCRQKDNHCSFHTSPSYLFVIKTHSTHSPTGITRIELHSQLSYTYHYLPLLSPSTLGFRTLPCTAVSNRILLIVAVSGVLTLSPSPSIPILGIGMANNVVLTPFISSSLLSFCCVLFGGVRRGESAFQTLALACS